MAVGIDDALQGVDTYLRTKVHKSVIHILHVIIVEDVEGLLHNHATGIDVMVEEECGDSRACLAVDYRPVDGSGTAVLWQQGGMHVECAVFGHCPHHLGQHTECHYHLQVGIKGAQLFHECLVLHLHRL